MRILIASLLMLPLAVAVQGQSVEAGKPAPVERIPVHTPEWTNPKDSDPGTTDSTASELQKIVVLCATEPQSNNFKKQWIAYVRGNYKSGMDVNSMVDEVMQQAANYSARRSRDVHEIRQTTTPAATRIMMHEAAMNSVRNMK